MHTDGAELKQGITIASKTVNYLQGRVYFQHPVVNAEYKRGPSVPLKLEVNLPPHYERVEEEGVGEKQIVCRGHNAVRKRKTGETRDAK